VKNDLHAGGLQKQKAAFSGQSPEFFPENSQKEKPHGPTQLEMNCDGCTLLSFLPPENTLKNRFFFIIHVCSRHFHWFYAPGKYSRKALSVSASVWGQKCRPNVLYFPGNRPGISTGIAKAAKQYDNFSDD